MDKINNNPNNGSFKKYGMYRNKLHLLISCVIIVRQCGVIFALLKSITWAILTENKQDLGPVNLLCVFMVKKAM